MAQELERSSTNQKVHPLPLLALWPPRSVLEQDTETQIAPDGSYIQLFPWNATAGFLLLNIVAPSTHLRATSQSHAQ